MDPSHTSSLVEKVRRCRQADRRSCAQELAKAGTDEAVGELIRMVRGDRRRGLLSYSVEDQLIGVEALGETANRKALEYLKHVYTCVETTERVPVKMYFMDDIRPDPCIEVGEETRVIGVFPNVPRGLQDRLWGQYAKETRELFNAALAKLSAGLGADDPSQKG
jgi:hypothetical protein